MIVYISLFISIKTWERHDEVSYAKGKDIPKYRKELKMLHAKITNLIMTKGNVRGSSDDFADIFQCTAAEATLCLRDLEREGIILKANPLPGSRAVYSYNHRNTETQPVIRRPTANYQTTVKDAAIV